MPPHAGLSADPRQTKRAWSWLLSPTIAPARPARCEGTVDESEQRKKAVGCRCDEYTQPNGVKPRASGDNPREWVLRSAPAIPDLCEHCLAILIRDDPEGKFHRNSRGRRPIVASEIQQIRRDPRRRREQQKIHTAIRSNLEKWNPAEPDESGEQQCPTPPSPPPNTKPLRLALIELGDAIENPHNTVPGWESEPGRSILNPKAAREINRAAAVVWRELDSVRGWLRSSRPAEGTRERRIYEHLERIHRAFSNRRFLGAKGNEATPAGTIARARLVLATQRQHHTADPISNQTIDSIHGAIEELAEPLELPTQIPSEENTQTTPSDLRPAKWFAQATRDGLGAETLRKARERGKLPGADRPTSSKIWRYPISEVCENWPEYERLIRDHAGRDRPDADSNGQTPG